MPRGGLGLFLPACTLELPVWHGGFTVVTKGVDRGEGNLQVLRNLENSFEVQMGSQEGGA